MIMSGEMLVWIGDLAAYNAGILHGEWFDAQNGAEQLNEDAASVIATSPVSDAEEWFIADTDWAYGWAPGEYDSFERVAEMATALAEHGSALAAYALNDGPTQDVDTIVSRFEDAYRGTFDSERDYAWQDAEESCLFEGASETLRSYFDVDSYARDLFMSDCFSVRSGEGDIFVYLNI